MKVDALVKDGRGLLEKFCVCALAGKYTTEDINDDYLKALEQSARVQLRAAPRSSPQLAAGAA